MRRLGVILLVTALLGFFATVPRVQAMDPVTIAILAPILMPYAQKAASYTLKAMIRTIPGWAQVGKEMINIFRLPLGFFQLAFLIPFGYAGDGLENIWDGAKAPVMMMVEFFGIPFRAFGVIRN